MADVPGLIEGAAGGAGLGTQFLRHLERTRLLLHLVDIAPSGTVADPAADARAIAAELAAYDPALSRKPRWLVLNKVDLLPEDAVAKHAQRVVTALGGEAPVFTVSALSGAGTRELAQAVMQWLEEAGGASS
jgi:GTP-binding protein